jgi:hypothetical protein
MLFDVKKIKFVGRIAFAEVLKFDSDPIYQFIK